MPPRTTVWELDDHTLGKHLVLKSYMDAWLPIVLNTYRRALFVDGFAGPGQYRNGEPGSPLIALDALAKHARHDVMTGQIEFAFIEERADRFAHLENVVAGRRSSLPSFCRVRTFNDTYEFVFPQLLDVLETDSAVPAFVMIDPFGVSGVFMDQVKTLMEYPSTEVYISFMYREINRFATQPEFTDHLNGLFGCEDWMQALEIEDPVARRESFHRTYERQLRNAGAKYVVPLQLYDGRRHVYTIFFATQNTQGCDKMKHAMWKAAPLGDFRFTGGLDRQFTLGPGIVDFDRLRDDLVGEFPMNEDVPVEAVENFMRSDRTLFHTSHYKKVLAEMERVGRLVVSKSPRKQRRRYPPGTVISFVEPPPPPPPEPVQMALGL